MKIKWILGALAALSLAACGSSPETKPVPEFKAPALVSVPAPLPAQKSAKETWDCVLGTFKHAPFTGTLQHKLYQARHIRANVTKVTINGVSTTLAAGETVSGKCSGPSETEVLQRRNEILNARLTNANRWFDAASAYTNQLKAFIADRGLAPPAKVTATSAASDSSWILDSIKGMARILGFILLAVAISTAFIYFFYYLYQGVKERVREWRVAREEREYSAPAPTRQAAEGTVHRSDAMSRTFGGGQPAEA